MSAAHSLRTEHLSLSYDRRAVLSGLSLAIPEEQITVIIGPNACGKSTLLRGMARLLRPAAGQVLLDGKSIHQMPTKQVSRTLGLLPQTPVAPDGILVCDLVGRGRYPHQGWLRQWSRDDEEAVISSLAATGTLELAGRAVDELSGGQRQRVWIAMALAQRTDLLLLDEPTTFLDLAHQIEVLDLLTDLNREGTTIVLVLHDLNLACRYADHLIAMRDGQVVLEGRPEDVVTSASVREVFAMDAVVRPDPVSQTPMVVPVGRHHSAVQPDNAALALEV